MNKAEDRGDLKESRGLGIFCTEAAFLTRRWYALPRGSRPASDADYARCRGWVMSAVLITGGHFRFALESRKRFSPALPWSVAPA
jgi:hypothetical protein